MHRLTIEERQIVDQAKSILLSHMRSGGDCVESPEAVRQFLELELAAEENEWFFVVFLDSKHRVITVKRLFQGSIASANVHLRVIVQEALRCNAAAMICAHNHPSGDPEPSYGDRTLTAKIANALDLIEVRFVDHVVVGNDCFFSFAQRGLL